MVNVMHQTGTWQQTVDQYRIMTDQDKVRHNTRDDYGLGPGWLYCAGAYRASATGSPVWHTVWVKLTDQCRDSVTPHCIDGIGSLSLSKTADRWSFRYQDKHMIASGIWCLEVDPDSLPEDIKNLFYQDDPDD